MSFRSHLPVRRRVFRVKLRFSVSVNFCRCFFVVVVYSLYVFSWSLSRVCAQFDCYNLFLSLWRPSNWLTHMQRHALLLTRFWGHQVIVRGNDVEICVGGRGEGGGAWQLSHSDKHLPLWTDMQGRGVVAVTWGTSLTTRLPQTCHSGCYHASSSGLGNGLLVRVGISAVTPGWNLKRNCLSSTPRKSAE